ncbi:hypothetical protein ACOSQ3_032560 [Xanthoceras sorbifolium]
MSFEVGPSKSSSSSSSLNPEEELDLTVTIEAQSQVTYAQHRAALNVIHRDTSINSHRGSIPSHKVIYRGREEAEHNLRADDNFAENPRYNESMFRK